MNEKKPDARFSRGRCSVSIFFNEVQKDGQTIRIPKAVFQKRYCDKNGEWHATQGLDVDDLPKAVLCLNEAFEFLTRRKSDERTS
jgi:hypothetical protein